MPTWLLLPVALVAGIVGYAASPRQDAPIAPAPPLTSAGSDPSPVHAADGPPHAAETAPPPASGSTSTSASTSTTLPAVDAASLLGRLKSIEALPPEDRTLASSLELERGHVELALLEVAALQVALGAAGDPALLTRLRRLAEDDAVAPAVLAAVAQHPSADGADFLHEVSTDSHASEAVRYLADDLLALPAVRGAATKALLVTLDLAAAKSCPAVEKLARRAQESGDARARAALGALESEVGCGPKRQDDCYPCLRGSTLLFEARAAASGRAYVAPWRARSP